MLDNYYYHIFVRNTYLFCMCDKRRRSRSISVPGANNQLFCPASMTSLWQVRKRDRRGSIHKSIRQRWRMSIKKLKTESDIRIFKDCDSTVGELRNPEDIGVEEMNMLLARFFFLRARNPSRFTNMIHWNVSKHPSVCILVMANVDIHAIVLTIENYENRTVTAISVKSNSVLSTVTNTNSLQQTAISVIPMMPNPRITLFPYSNIEEYVTIIFYGTNDKNLNSDLYWKVMFNSCDKYGELYCWLFVDVIYFVVILMNKHKFFIYF